MNVRKFTLSMAIVFLVVSISNAQNWWKNRISGEGEIVERTLDAPDFDGFSLGVSANVKVKQGDKQEIIVRAQSNIIDNIVLKNEGGHLKITYDRPIWRSKGITILMTVPSLDKVAVSGSGNVEGVGTFEGLDDFMVSVSGSGNVDLALEAKRVGAKVSGSGNVKLAGTGTRLETSVSGSGNVRAADLKVEEADVSVSGSGNVQVYATEYLDASVSGSGDVRFKGQPRLKAKTSGSGDIESM